MGRERRPRHVKDGGRVQAGARGTAGVIAGAETHSAKFSVDRGVFACSGRRSPLYYGRFPGRIVTRQGVRLEAPTRFRANRRTRSASSRPKATWAQPHMEPLEIHGVTKLAHLHLNRRRSICRCDDRRAVRYRKSAALSGENQSPRFEDFSFKVREISDHGLDLHSPTGL